MTTKIEFYRQDEYASWAHAYDSGAVYSHRFVSEDPIAQQDALGAVKAALDMMDGNFEKYVVIRTVEEVELTRQEEMFLASFDSNVRGDVTPEILKEFLSDNSSGAFSQKHGIGMYTDIANAWGMWRGAMRYSEDLAEEDQEVKDWNESFEPPPKEPVKWKVIVHASFQRAYVVEAIDEEEAKDKGWRKCDSAYSGIGVDTEVIEIERSK